MISKAVLVKDRCFLPNMSSADTQVCYRTIQYDKKIAFAHCSLGDSPQLNPNIPIQSPTGYKKTFMIGEDKSSGMLLNIPSMHAIV